MILILINKRNIVYYKSQTNINEWKQNYYRLVIDFSNLITVKITRSNKSKPFKIKSANRLNYENNKGNIYKKNSVLIKKKKDICGVCRIDKLNQIVVKLSSKYKYQIFLFRLVIIYLSTINYFITLLSIIS